MNRKILLMDEPFGALYLHTRQKMQRHLMDLWQNIDITIIFVTHDMDEAILLADRIVALKANPVKSRKLSKLIYLVHAIQTSCLVLNLNS